MSPRFPLDARAQRVRVSDLRAYLLTRGWKPQPFPQPEVLRFDGPPDDDGNPLVLLMPASEALSDYLRRVEDLLTSLSQFEDRPASEILRDLLTPTCDKLYVRLDAPDTRAGTLLVGFALQFFDNLKNLLTFAACAEFDPRRYFPRALKEGIAFANRCRLAGAPAQSFGVEIETPLVPPASEVEKQLHAYPRERRILAGLMQGLGHVRRAADSGDSSEVFNRRDLHMNANICDALLGMRPEVSDVSLELVVSWSLAWPMNGQEIPTRVIFEGRGFEMVESLGRALRGVEETRPRLWRGHVVRLAAEDPVLGEDEGLFVTVRVQSRGVPLRVELRLNPEHYRLAAQAHLAGKPVVARGVLERIGRRARLIDLTDFQVAEENPPVTA
jgi:hypothetical protein